MAQAPSPSRSLSSAAVASNVSHGRPRAQGSLETFQRACARSRKLQAQAPTCSLRIVARGRLGLALSPCTQVTMAVRLGRHGSRMGRQ